MSMDDNPRTINGDPTIFPPSADEGPVGSPSASPSGDTGKKGKPFRSAGPIWSVILGLIVALALIIFFAQNTREVQVSYFGWDGQVSLALVVLVTAFAAVVIDELVGFVLRFKNRKTRNERAELKRLRQQQGS